MTLEERIVAHLSRATWESLPRDAREAARRCILDTIAVTLAGSSGQDVDRLVQWLTARGGPPEAAVLVHGVRLPASHATWANSAMARAREFDDSHDPTGDHTSVPILSAALAAAELRGGVSGRDFVTAYVLAADLVARLRLAPLKKVGSTGFAANTFAPFAAATAAGLILGLRGQSLYDALGWAYAQAAGAVQLQQGGQSASMSITASPLRPAFKPHSSLVRGFPERTSSLRASLASTTPMWAGSTTRARSPRPWANGSRSRGCPSSSIPPG